MPAVNIVAPFPFTVPQRGPDLRVFYASGILLSDLPGTSSGGPPWQGRDPAGPLYGLLRGGHPLGDLAAVPYLAPATLAAGVGVGVVFGLVMYSVAPLGLSQQATNPWLRGSQIDPACGARVDPAFRPAVAAGVLAGWRYCRRPGRSIKLAQARITQGIVAGVLANLVGALFVTVLGTGTIALTIKVARLRPWVYHAQHLSAAAAYRHELTACANAGIYGLMCVVFPVIGLIMGALGLSCFMPVPRQSGPQPGNGGWVRARPGADAGSSRWRPGGPMPMRTGCWPPSDPGAPSDPGLPRQPV